MTPDALIAELRRLVAAQRDQEALDLSSRVVPTLRNQLTTEDVYRIAEVMHLAQMAVDLEEWDATSQRPRTDTPASRSA